MLRLIMLSLGCCAMIWTPSTFEGQAVKAPTPYDTQALRVETGWWEQVLVRGREGRVVGKIGPLRRLDLVAAVASSPDAVREAKEYMWRNRQGSIFQTVGALSFLGGMAVASANSGDAAVTIPAYSAAVIGGYLLLRGGYQLNKAASALARSLWWYNRDLGQ